MHFQLRVWIEPSLWAALSEGHATSEYTMQAPVSHGSVEPRKLVGVGTGATQPSGTCQP